MSQVTGSLTLIPEQINRGDTVKLQLDFAVSGTALEEYAPDEIELLIKGNRFLLSAEDISLDEDSGKYVVILDQKKSFRLSDIAWYQLRIRKDEDVMSSDISHVDIGKTISGKVI